jgi:arsenate reductase (glutaredoxin)
MEIWFNPSCSKCRIAGQELADAGLDVPQRRYLDDVPTSAELATVLDRLAMQPWQLARLGEPVAKELGMSAWGRQPQDRDRWIEAMVANPKLIQRPIVLLDDGRAVVARSPEAIKEAIDSAKA